MYRLAKWSAAIATAPAVAAGAATAQVKELRIGYQPSPIQDASIAMFETWGAKNGIKIVKVPNSYGVYVEKMTASLTSNSDQYDVIWHNDDWGQTVGPSARADGRRRGLKFAENPGASHRSCSAMRRARTPSCRWARPSACSSTAPTWSSPRRCPRRCDDVVTDEQEAAGRQARSSSATSAACR